MRRLGMLILVVIVGMATATGVSQAAAPTDGDRWALVVGIDQFEGATRPNSGAVGDAEDVRAALVAAGWPASHIKVLTDGDATRSAITAGLSWLAGVSTDTSFSVFAYSGHVKQAGSTEYLWPHDNQFMADTEVAASLRAVKGYLWAHFSGCEAAGFDEGLSGPRRLVTAAAQSNEKGYELSPELRNSVFTNLLVEKGLLRRLADANHDGRVSIQEAFRLAAEQAPTLTANEAYGPQHPYMAGGEGREWFLERAAQRAPAEDAGAGPPARHCLLFLCL